MQSIKLKSHVGSDGILRLEVPLDLQNTDLEVLIVVQPLKTKLATTVLEDLGWFPGFFEEVAGGWVGEPLLREEQGEYETRDELR